MINPNLEKLVKVVVDYSLKVEKGHLVGINGPSFAVDMFQALAAEIMKKGAHFLIVPRLEGITELKYKYSTDEQLEYVDYFERGVYTELDRLIEIRADYIKFKKNRDDADHERTHIARLYSKVCDENKLLLLRAVKAENDIKPTRESLNLMTAERGRWLRKLRKAGVKV